MLNCKYQCSAIFKAPSFQFRELALQCKLMHCLARILWGLILGWCGFSDRKLVHGPPYFVTYVNIAL